MNNDEKDLNVVDRIIESLQQDKWENHKNQLLISSQGKLASYMGNIGAIVARAEYEYRIRAINHEQYEKERYFYYRNTMSQKDSEMQAKLDAFAKEKTVFEAKERWLSLKSILKAMHSLSVACSTSLKHQKIDRDNSNFMGN